MANLQYIGARYVPKFFENPDDQSNDWKSGVLYEALTIVTYNNDSYTSKKTVPANIGDPASNPAYWVCTTKYSAAIIALQTIVGNLQDFVGSGPLDTVAQTLAGAVNELDKKIIVVSDYEGNSDAEILQAAINDAIDKLFPVVIVDRTYDITGSTIYIDKGLYTDLPDSKYYRSKLTFIGVNSAEIIKRDTGYMFSATQSSADMTFMNLRFRGGVSITDDMSRADEIAALKLGCDVFDTSRLARFNTINCSYTLLGTVFSGKDCTNSANHAQSICSLNDMASFCDAFWSFLFAWDCTIDNAIVEQCNAGIIDVDSADGLSVRKLSVSDSTFEGLFEHGISLKANNHDTSLLAMIDINHTYFEDIADDAIVLDPAYGYRLAVNYNYIVQHSNVNSCIYIRTDGAYATVHGNYLISGAYGVKVTALGAKIDMMDNSYFQDGGQGTFTNSTGAYTKLDSYQLETYISSVDTDSTAPDTTKVATITDFGDIATVKAIIPLSVLNLSDYNSWARVIGVTFGSITIRTQGSSTQAYRIAYLVLGYK